MRSRQIAAVLICALAATAVGVAAPSADAAPRWAPASKATIHPGVRTSTSGISCTTNFVFYDAHAVYLGQAASCSGGAPSGHCPRSPLPLGTPVKIQGASRPGRIVYNSRLTMERVGEGRDAACWFNDFALVRVDNADKGRVNPSVPFWGGPLAGPARSRPMDAVYSYGNAAVYCWEDGCRPPNVNELAPRWGINTGTALMPNLPWGGLRPDGDTAGWLYYIHTAAPGASGLRGSAVLDRHGRALGVVRGPTYDFADRVLNVGKAVAYMKANTNLDGVKFATGTEAFAPPH